MDRLRASLAVFATLVLTACGVGASDDEPTFAPANVSPESTPPAGSTPAESGLPCEVDTILATKCQTCHAAEPKFGAGFPLVTYADLVAPARSDASKKVYDLVKGRVHDDARPMPPSPNPRLTEKERAAIDAWIAGGAKPSTDRCKREVTPSGVKPLSCKPDTVLKPSKPFVMQPNAPRDQYMCFGVDVKVDKKRHVTAFAPKVENTKMVHHILLFQSPVGVPSEPFPCSGVGTVGSAAWTLMGGWAPGADNFELPPEAGFPEDGTTHWIVQVHYNNALVQSGTDSSGYELCTTDQLRPNDAGVVGFGTMAIAIPPRATHTLRCDFPVGPALHGKTFFNAWPHMHKRGTAMSTERLPLGGKPEMVFEEKAYSFEAQQNRKIHAKVSLGDVMRTRCTYKNPSDNFVTFGEATDNEMCFNFTAYYPAIPAYSWVTPSLLAACASE